LLAASVLAVFALLAATPGTLRANLFWSESNNEPVWSAIADRLPASIELELTALLAALVLGAFGGFVRARARAPVLRELLALPELVVRAMPVFFLALGGQLLLMFTTSVPIAGISLSETFDLRDRLSHLVAPALLLGIPFGAWSSLVFYDVFRAPNGTSVRGIAGAAATAAAAVGPALIAASLFVETMFAWPGLGRLWNYGLGQLDFAIVAAILLMYSAAIVLLKLVADFSPSVPDRTLGQQAGSLSAAFSLKRFSAIGIVALIVLVVTALVGLTANLIAPANPNYIDQVHWQGYPLHPGVAGHVLGTDENGRDLLSRLFVAIRMSLGIAVFAAVVATVIGAVVARTVPWFGDARSTLSVAGIRAFAALPFILSAVLVAVKFHNARILTPPAEALIIAAVSWPWVVPAFRRLTPATLGAVADVTGGALLMEVTLSFFGYGVRAPEASLGNMLQNAQVTLTMGPWITIVPVVVIVALLFAFYALGEEFRERAAS
jgi:peptide/nickel transport system permease protein